MSPMPTNPNMDATDWFMMLFTAALAGSGTVYLFLHPAEATFATWAALLTAQGGVFHGLNIFYDKRQKENAP